MYLDSVMLLLGITGVIAIGANFLLEAMNKLKGNHHAFAWINLYGSSALFVYSYYNEVWLFVVLNVFLIGTGLYGLWRVYKR